MSTPAGERRPTRARVEALRRGGAAGHARVTREDWLRVALDLLISDGVEAVKVAVIGEKLQVSRSSFYWYFDNRRDLLDALIERWQRSNTRALVAQAEAPAATITAAVCNVFRCAVDPGLFDNRLDFAVRDWARKQGSVRGILDRSDGRRLAALAAMFRRYDYDERDALTRARILYFMQLGYSDAELHESMEERLELLPNYLEAFTGREPKAAEIADFTRYVRHIHETSGDE